MHMGFHVPDNQWGFCTSVLSSLHQWGFSQGKSNCHRSAIDIPLSVSVYVTDFNVILDLSKAYDSVPHVPLLHHLKDTGLNPYIVQWIAFYLLNRTQYVVVQGESSTDTSDVSGVPQGSVLGPLLFLSLPSVPSALSNGAQMTLYADDLLLTKPIKVANDYILLQQDITTITNHIEELHLTLNASVYSGVKKKTASSPSSRNIHQ